MNRITLLTLTVVLALSTTTARAELTSDQILLIVNKNSPDSRSIADFYVKARKLPDDRIIELDLPLADEMSFDLYERGVVPVVRNYLSNHHLTDQIKCLVTVYGVPLKIAARKNSAQETDELTALKHSRVGAEIALNKIASHLEELATTADPDFRGLPQNQTTAGADGAMRRADHASKSLAVSLMRIDDQELRRQRIAEVTAVMNQLRAPTPPTVAPTNAATTEPAATEEAALTDDPADRRYDPVARRRLRETLSKRSLFEYAQLLNAQIDYLTPTGTDAAFDNELALLWWPSYPRENFLPNVLNYNYMKSRTPPVVMTMRLDAPTPQMVRDLIATSIEVERDGLKGGIVVDAGGSAKLDPQKKNLGITAFEHRFYDLATLVRASTKLLLCYDQGPEVLPPNSAKDVALYTGWYSVGVYKPCCKFSRGAIGYHVASYEMTSLHDNNNSGWCRGLMNDGCVATLGPVSEPYLGAFPFPDDFMPLLMTGQLTLAEVYWRTTPLVSWKIAMVGDPLYQPYKAHPALAASDLPERLRPLLTMPSQK